MPSSAELASDYFHGHVMVIHLKIFLKSDPQRPIVTGTSMDVNTMQDHQTFLYNTTGTHDLLLVISINVNSHWAHTTMSRTYKNA